GGIVLGHADVIHLQATTAALEAIESIVAEDAGHLAGTVGAEGHEDHGIAVLHAAALAGNHGPHKLIGHIGSIAGIDGLLSVGGMVALAVHDGCLVVCRAVPDAVPVHGVVT